MRSFKTLAAAAVLAAGVGLAAPAAAHAGTTLPGTAASTSDACSAAVAIADKAQAAYDAALADIKKQVANGGHPGKAELDNLEDLRRAADAAASEAARVCGHADDADHHHRPWPPHGGMHTGTGSTSQGTDGAGTGLGAALVGAAGLGLVVSRRRKARLTAQR